MLIDDFNIFVLPCVSFLLGNHRGYGTANPSGSYATTAPSYLYDSNNGITSAGVPMDYAATSALLQQHAAAAAATQAQLGGFASHQGQRTAALDHVG